MTDKTTRIYVDLTDEQMGHHLRTYASAGTASAILWYAIKEQRPHPIAVGDQVRLPGDDRILTVVALQGDYAWLWRDRGPWASAVIAELTRVGDEATA